MKLSTSIVTKAVACLLMLALAVWTIPNRIAHLSFRGGDIGILGLYCRHKSEEEAAV
jgi:hypothetical protein